METLNIGWLKKVEKVHDRFDRHVPTNSIQKICTQSIFINRYFKFLDGKTFKLKIEDCIYYALFLKQKTIGTDYYYNSYGVEKHLGYNNYEFSISFFDEKLKRRDFKLHWNDIISIEYEEIPTKKYYEIVKLFIQ
jgi:hypothetical protein